MKVAEKAKALVLFGRWGDTHGVTLSGRFYLSGSVASDDHIIAPAGMVLAAVTQDLALSGIPAETAIEADGAEFTVMGFAPWAEGWTRHTKSRDHTPSGVARPGTRSPQASHRPLGRPRPSGCALDRANGPRPRRC